MSKLEGDSNPLMLRQALSSRPTGGVWAMGRNAHGQLGLGAADDADHPTAAQLAALGSGVVRWPRAASTASARR